MLSASFALAVCALASGDAYISSGWRGRHSRLGAGEAEAVFGIVTVRKLDGVGAPGHEGL